ncbi:MAG: hypothetical protein INQ03_04955 [Candidatus Heimdallarchaeota archaeon]|nr:hypothetical protein [Candidatus Heimdallarchaeota archaeon]
MSNLKFQAISIWILLILFCQYPIMTSSGEGPVPPPRLGHQMVYLEEYDRLLLFGGNTNLNNWRNCFLNDTWSYNPDSGEWEELKPNSAPSARAWHAMVYNSLNHKVYLFGGVDPEMRLNDIWEYDFSQNSWTEIYPEYRIPERSSSPLIFDPSNDRLLLFGGYGLNDQKLNDMWEFSISDYNWTRIVNDESPPKRYGHGMTFNTMNQQVLLHGGNDFEKLADTWIFENNSWSEVFPPNKPSPRYWHSVIYDSNLNIAITFGGRIGSPLEMKADHESWIFDFEINSWSNQTSPESPSARFDYAMTVSADKSLVYLNGGYDAKIILGDFWQYDILKGSWNNIQYDLDSEIVETIINFNFLVIPSVIVLRKRTNRSYPID